MPLLICRVFQHYDNTIAFRYIDPDSNQLRGTNVEINLTSDAQEFYRRRTDVLMMVLQPLVVLAVLRRIEISRVFSSGQRQVIRVIYGGRTDGAFEESCYQILREKVSVPAAVEILSLDDLNQLCKDENDPSKHDPVEEMSKWVLSQMKRVGRKRWWPDGLWTFQPSAVFSVQEHTTDTPSFLHADTQRSLRPCSALRHAKDTPSRDPAVLDAQMQTSPPTPHKTTEAPSGDRIQFILPSSDQVPQTQAWWRPSVS